MAAITPKASIDTINIIRRVDGCFNPCSDGRRFGVWVS